jgi:hypothetical protein
MDFEKMGLRLAALPRRRAVLTTKANMDEDASGAPRFHQMDELVDYLGKSHLNAVLVENGAKDGWVAVFLEREGGRYEVARVPTDDPDNVLTKKVESAADALSAAMQL